MWTGVLPHNRLRSGFWGARHWHRKGRRRKQQCTVCSALSRPKGAASPKWRRMEGIEQAQRLATFSGHSVATLQVISLAPAQGHRSCKQNAVEDTTPGLRQQAASGNMDIFKLLQSNSLIYACLCLRDHHQPPDTGWDSAASLS